MSVGGRLVAINHVELRSPPGIETELHWFYGELIGLAPVPQLADGAGSVPPMLRFRSEQLELRVTMVDGTLVDPVPFRVVVEVPQLPLAAEMLQDRGYAFAWHRGMLGTDRSISVIDPGGHRVAIRRLWPWTLL